MAVMANPASIHTTFAQILHSPSAFNRRPGFKESSHRQFAQKVIELIHFVRGLMALPDDWISGQSVRPNSTAVTHGIIFLALLLSRSKEEANFPIPSLILSPIPTGGLAIELHFGQVASAQLTFSNGGLCTLETESRGRYQDEQQSSSVATVLDMVFAFVRAELLSVYV